MDQIHNFLKLDLKHAQGGGTPVFDLPQKVAPLFATDAADSPVVSDDASSATSSEESFERVSTADLAEYDAAATEAKPSPSDLLPGQGDEECAAVDPATHDVNTGSSGDIPCEYS